MIDPRGGHNRYNFNEEFFTQWTTEMAYVLGFLYADGNITDAKSSRTQYIKFTNTEKEILIKIKSVLRAEHPIHTREPQLVRHSNGEYLSRRIFILRIGSRKVFKHLTNIGLMPNKSKSITLPSVPTDLFNHFLRGYFDGDGCVYIEPNILKSGEKSAKRLRVTFTSGSKKYLKELDNTISANINVQKGGIYKSQGAFNLVYPTGTSIKLFKFMYNNTDYLFLERKYNKFQEYVSIRGL